MRSKYNSILSSSVNQGDRKVQNPRWTGEEFNLTALGRNPIWLDWAVMMDWRNLFWLTGEEFNAGLEEFNLDGLGSDWRSVLGSELGSNLFWLAGRNLFWLAGRNLF
jgi:hypothetical protein